MDITNEHVEKIITEYVERYLRGNQAATALRNALAATGVGLRPVIDHLSIRTLDVQERAPEFEAIGFRYDDHLGVIESESWWAKVYRRPGFPAIYIAQAFTDQRGAESSFPGWVQRFSDRNLHHIGVLVDNVEVAIERMHSLGVPFAGKIEGDRRSGFRHIYTEPEVVESQPFTVLELVERHWGFTGFISQPNALTNI
jgi:hypothetical protein